jgi:hypothetical protein
MSRVISTAHINNIAGANAKTGVVTGKIPNITQPEGFEKFTGQIVAVMTLDDNLAPTIEHSIFTDADQAYSSIAFGNVMHCDSWEVRYIHLGKHICVVHVQKVNTNVDYPAFEIEKNLQKYYSNFTGIENDYRFATYWKITYFGQEKFNDEVDAISKLFELMKKNYT